MPAGFTITGIEPFELATFPDPVKLMFWDWVVSFGIIAKDRDLAKGLDAEGEPLRPISRKTRRYRRSAMTPDGRGDPSAPPLSPGRKLSRVRSLLAGRATTESAEFWWRYDPWTGDTFSTILTYQQEQGRDVFGLSPDATNWVRLKALGKWRDWLRSKQAVPQEYFGRRVLGPLGRTPGQQPVYQKPPGFTDRSSGTFGIGPTPSGPNWSGGMTERMLKDWIRGTAPANVQGRPGEAYNRLLSHLWGHPGQGPSGGGAIKPLVPMPVRPPKIAAMPLMEKPIQKPVPPVVPVKVVTAQHILQIAEGLIDPSGRGIIADLRLSTGLSKEEFDRMFTDMLLSGKMTATEANDPSHLRAYPHIEAGKFVTPSGSERHYFHLTRR